MIPFKRKHLFIGIPLAILALFLFTVRLLTAERDAELQFTVVDAVSGSWIHGLTAELQDTYSLGFYQTDFIFDNLDRGKASLKITAPDYATETRTVHLTSGRRSILEGDREGPLELQGLRIPDLAYFLVFEKEDGGDYLAQLRPVNENGKGIVYHPCLDIKIGCRVWEDRGEETEERRGELLYSAILDWTWDDTFGQVYRYYARIDGSEIEPTGTESWIIDYLILVPEDGGKSDEVKERVETIIDEAGTIQNEERLIEYLEKQREFIDYYLDTSTDVEAL